MNHVAYKRSLESAIAYESGTCPIEESGWVTERGVNHYQTLQQEISADVVVVGAGLVGSSLALHLQERNLSVAVLESANPGFGASGRNAGHMRPYIRSPSPGLPGQNGAIFDFFHENINVVFDICKKYGIEANAEQTGYLEVARTRWAKPEFLKTEKQWKKLGFNVSMIGREEVINLSGSREYRYGLHWEEGGSVNPYQFVNGMINAVVQLGGKVFGNSPAIALEKNGDDWVVKTPRGSVAAKKVVFCTNGHFGGKVFPGLAHTNYPMTVCALATKPIEMSLRSLINPSRAALIQRPTGLAPLVIDRLGRLITAQIPDYQRAHEAGVYLKRFLKYLHRAYPETKGANIELESYWTGRIYTSGSELPQAFHLGEDVFALVNTGTSGNLMGPMIGRHFAECLASDATAKFILPLGAVNPLPDQSSFERNIRRWLMPVARFADQMGIL